MTQDMARVGLVGLGVMGANLALNIAEKGFPVAVHNRSADKVDAFVRDAGPLSDNVIGCRTPEALAAALQPPRAIILMVQAGDAVDRTIDSLLPFLSPGDLLIDAGNADFNDTRRREAELHEAGFAFIGMGVSGGAEGARHGPSIMVGGPEGQYEAIRDVVEAIAAPYDDKPCAAHLGPDGAGHFVKTVHNGIEYADMQLIAEVFDCLRDGGARRMTEIATLFSDWNTGPLNSYLVEITAKILGAADPETGKPVVDVILDRAGQKGTGRWTAIEALRLGRSPSVIEAAVGARSWSAEKAVRRAGAGLFTGPDEVLGAPALDADLEAALLAARIIAYAQGFSVLAAASDEYQWDLDMARIAEIWRAGCIIRSGLLDDIALAFRNDPPQGQMIFAPFFVDRLEACMPGLRRVVAHGAKAGLPMPALSAALSWFDTMRRARGPASLIQAQRDFFGAHGFERVDAEGEHHGPWA